jgi:hypothetical protein
MHHIGFDRFFASNTMRRKTGFYWHKAPSGDIAGDRDRFGATFRPFISRDVKLGE